MTFQLFNINYRNPVDDKRLQSPNPLDQITTQPQPSPLVEVIVAEDAPKSDVDIIDLTSDDETSDNEKNYASSYNGSDDEYSAHKESDNESDNSSLYDGSDDDLTSDVDKNVNKCEYASSQDGSDDDVSIKVSSDDEECKNDTRGSGNIDYQQQLQEYRRLKQQQRAQEKHIDHILKKERQERRQERRHEHIMRQHRQRQIQQLLQRQLQRQPQSREQRLQQELQQQRKQIERHQQQLRQQEEDRVKQLYELHKQLCFHEKHGSDPNAESDEERHASLKRKYNNLLCDGNDDVSDHEGRETQEGGSRKRKRFEDDDGDEEDIQDPFINGPLGRFKLRRLQ